MTTSPTAPVVEAFSAHAAEYDALRRRLVPDYDGFYGAVVDALERAVAGEVRRVLDLGAGTGLLSAVVAEAFGEAQIELLDASEPMLALAQRRLGGAVGAVHVADMSAPLPAGPFDAVISALAIHHLEHADKRALMGRIHGALRPGGAFVNAEQVDAPTAELTAIYAQRWADDCRALGASEEEIDGARGRMRHDRCTDVETQLGWLRDAGFATADCTYKSWRFAVLIARKEG
ncbi:MAG TPA: class I SAM-dependent methyltransferase [Solirubrobacteraceae bacterium]|nr:class I SAM-dependent methyltransferase [Solirubrobacteraceae bacterium]